MTVVRHTWFMIGRQTRNLLREPIWIVILLVQPMVWLRALRPAVQERHTARRIRHDVVHHVPRAGDRRDERVLQRELEWHVDGVRHRPQVRRALPRNARIATSLVLSQIVRSSFQAALQAIMILLIALVARRAHPHRCARLARDPRRRDRRERAFAGISQGIALLVATRGDGDRTCELHQPAAALPLLDAARAVADAALDALAWRASTR